MSKNKIIGIIVSVLAIGAVGFYLWQSHMQKSGPKLSEEPIKEERIQVTDQENPEYRSSVLINSVEKESDYGTGYVVGKNAVATNRHVVESVYDHPEKAVVRVGHKDKDGNVEFVDFKIKKITVPDDKAIDVAVLNLEPQADGKTVSDYRRIAEFGDISKVKEGTRVTVVGFPGDKEYGTLWASSGDVDMMMDSIISFKAVTAPGNSGSPMFDSEGKVIGMNNAGEENNSFGFLIDDTIRSFIEEHAAQE